LGIYPWGIPLFFIVSEFKRGRTYTSDGPRSERSKTAITVKSYGY